MRDGSMTMLNIELGTEFFEFLIIKLSAIIGDDNSTKTKPGDDELLDELPGFGLDDVGHWLGFVPFGEVINSHD